MNKFNFYFGVVFFLVLIGFSLASVQNFTQFGSISGFAVNGEKQDYSDECSRFGLNIVEIKSDFFDDYVRIGLEDGSKVDKIVILAFTNQGEEICEASVGNLKQYQEKIVTCTNIDQADKIALTPMIKQSDRNFHSCSSIVFNNIKRFVEG